MGTQGCGRGNQLTIHESTCGFVAHSALQAEYRVCYEAFLGVFTTIFSESRFTKTPGSWCDLVKGCESEWLLDALLEDIRALCFLLIDVRVCKVNRVTVCESQVLALYIARDSSIA